MTAFCLIWIPIVAVWRVYKARGHLWQVEHSVYINMQIKCLFFWKYMLCFFYDSMIFVIQRVKSACMPTEDWGPYLEHHRREHYGARVVPDANIFAISNKCDTRL